MLKLLVCLVRYHITYIKTLKGIRIRNHYADPDPQHWPQHTHSFNIPIVVLSCSVDTNFVNFSIKNKMDIIQSMMDCLYAKCIPYITDCVMAELEKLGAKYRIALRIVKDPRFERLPCIHKGTYADDCLVNR